MFEESKDLTTGSTTLAQKCRDYYDGYQLTDEEKEVLRKRKQPAVVLNLVGQKGDYYMGVEAQSRTDPKAYPRTPNSEDSAEAATDSIRYVCDNSDFDNTASECFSNLVIEGTEACIIEVVGKKKEIIPRWVPWDRCFYDPHSIRRDFSDATYMGVVAWMDLDVAQSKWPKAKDSLETQVNEHNQFDDKPSHWTDSKRRRVMAVEIYFQRGGKWLRAMFTKGAVLEEAADSVYLDEDGSPANAMEMQSYKTDRKGGRYGALAIYLDSQDEVNKRKSKSLHAMSTRQTWSKKGRIENIPAFKREAAKPDGHIEFPEEGVLDKDFGLMPDTGMSAQQFAMYQESVQQIDRTGPNSANVGNSDNASGRAIQSQQQAGLTESAPLYDAHAQFKKRIYRKIWNCIRQFWNEERWVRVTDDEENVKFVGLNHPVTYREHLEKQHGPIPDEHPMAQDARLDSVMKVENKVGELDVDIIIDEMQDVVNLQAEQAELILRMFEANPQGVPWEAVVESSQLRARNKQKVLGKGDPEREQQALQAQQEQKQKENALFTLEMEGRQLELKGKEVEIQDKQASIAERQTKIDESEVKQEKEKSEILLNMEELNRARVERKVFTLDPTGKIRAKANV